jgi:hypothetical protein
MRALTEPYDAAKYDALTARALDIVRSPGTAPAPVARASAPAAAKPKGRRTGVVIAFAGTLAAAAAVLLLVREPGGALPGYSVEVAGIDRGLRGPSDPPAAARPKVSEGARLSIVLRPAEPVAYDVDAIAVVDAPSGPRPSGVAPVVRPGGVVVLEGDERRVLADAHGAIDLVIAVGPRGSLPREPGDVARLESSGSRRFVTRIALETP